MKKQIKPFVFAAGLILIGALAWSGYQHFFAQGTSNAPAAALHDVTTGDIEQVVTAQGKLEPKDSVAVGAQVSGQIKVLHVDFGDTVESGQLIAEIDPELYEAEVRGGEARLKTLKAQRDQQQAQVTQASQKWARNEKLYKAKAVSQEVWQDAQTSLKIAKAQLVSLDAQIEEAQSTLEGDIANLNYTKIYAPMSGTVVNVATKEGETLNANQTTPTIVEVADLDTMTVRAQVAEADVNKLTTSMPIYFTTLGSQERKWQGTVRQILPSPEEINDVVLYNVLVDVENEDRQLMTGMTTQMFFVLGRAQGVPLIPASILTKRAPQSDTPEGQAYVVTVMKGKQPEKRTIIIGLNDRTSAQVLSGLRAGERVVMPAPGASAEQPGGGRMRMPRL